MIPQRDKSELKQIAKDLFHNQIFTDRHVQENDVDLIPSIFMTLMFLDEEQREEFVENPPGLLYERYDRAGPRSINGYPIFMSMNMLSEEDADTVFEYYDRLVEAEQEVFGDE